MEITVVILFITNFITIALYLMERSDHMDSRMDRNRYKSQAEWLQMVITKNAMRSITRKDDDS